MSWDTCNDTNVVPNKWEDEDASSDAAVGDDWDASSDDEEKVPEPKPQPDAKPKQQQQQLQPKPKLIVREKTKEEVKRDIQRSNLALTEDLFGVSAEPEEGNKPTQSRGGHALNAEFSNLSISNEADYVAFAKDVNGRLAPERRTHPLRMAFLKELLTSASEPLSLDELNDVKKIVTVLCNAKIKAQQNVTKKKKGRKGGKQHIKMSTSTAFNEDDVEYDGGDFDDMF